MKKILLIAVAAFGMLMTACSKDEVAQPVVEESTVTFTISTPELATRAHGDGLTATDLEYAVYNRADGAFLFKGTATMSALKATVEIPFVNGMEYDVLFWAEAPASPYTVNWTTKTVAYTNAAALVSNSEAYDAFYAYVNDIPEITGPVTKSVELKRPFAQLNIITNDTDEAEQSGVVVEDVKVVVEGAYTDFDLVNHKGLTKGTVTFGTAAAQTTTDVLAVNYLFPAAEKSLVDVEFTYTDVNGKLAAAGEVKEFATVPIQRNYRTNIVGSLLTSEGTFNVEIKEGFDGTNDHSVAVATPDDINALIQNPDVTTVELGAGVYNIDLYNLNEKRTLTINGTEGSKIEFKNLQVRASQFDELVINNCEILRMPDKSWGHLVFGSSDNAAGVYTISNCTFNGVGSQGIYINETVSGVTYNILNCTFNGNFGNEGAITIQTNQNVDHIVNVKGCTFNNIPDTSHRIFLASWDGQGSFYYGWTLNTDLKATTIYEVKSFIKLGFETINLADGTYKMTQIDNIQGKTITFVGSKNVVFDAVDVDANNQFVTGTTLAFEGVTINFDNVNYKGFANCSSLSYKDCDINGLQFLYNPTTFENCKFNSNGAEHSVWTYSSEDISFTDCEFTYGDRCVNVYVDNGANAPGITSDVAFTNCEFNTTNASSKGAVEINSSPFTAGVTVALTGCTAPAYGEMVYISEWDPTYGATANVTVDGVKVLPDLIKNGNVWEIHTAAGFAKLSGTTIPANVTEIKLMVDIDMQNAEFAGMANENTKVNLVFNGNNKTISNIKLKTAKHFGMDTAVGLFDSVTMRFADSSFECKDLTLENVSFADEVNAKWAGAVIGYAQIEAPDQFKLTNVHVKNSNLKGKATIAGMIGMLATPASLYAKDCSVTNSTIEATEKRAAAYVGLCNSPANATPIVFENCTIGSDVTITAPTGTADGYIGENVNGTGVTIQ